MSSPKEKRTRVIAGVACLAVLASALAYIVTLQARIRNVERATADLREMYGSLFLNSVRLPEFFKETMPEQELRAVVKLENEIALGRLKAALFIYGVYKERGVVPRGQKQEEKFAALVSDFYRKANVAIPASDPAGWANIISDPHVLKAQFAPGITLPELTKNEYAALSKKFVERWKDQLTFTSP